MSRTAWSVAFVLVSLIATAGPASAQTKAGAEFRVNSYTTGNQLYPTVGRDTRGNFVIVWDDRTNYLLQGQRYDRAGTRVGAEFNVSTAQYAYFPAMAVGPKGNFVVVWTHYPDGNQGGIRGQRFDAAANRLGAEFQVNTYTTNYQQRGNVALDGQGNFVVIWWSLLQDGAGQGMFAQRFDNQGNRRGGEFQVNTYTTGNQFFSDVSADTAGNFVVAWTSNPGTDLSGLSVNAQRYDANGVPQGANFQVNTYTTGNQLSAGVTHMADGSFFIGFQSNQNEAAGDVIVKRYDASGNPVGAEFQVNTTYTAGQQGYPDFALDAQGNFVVSWWDRTVSDGSSYGVFGRRFLANGTPRGADFLINTYTTGQQIPHRMATTIASDAVGNFVVSWDSRNGQDGSGTGDFAQRWGGLHPNAMQVDTTGNLVWEPGESIDVRPNWFNANGAAQTFGAALTNLAGPAGATYTLVDGVGSYGTVANNVSAVCTDCYQVSVNNPTPRPVQHWDASALESITPDTQGQQKRWALHIGNSFTDVPTSNGFYRFIETLLHHQITGGCGGTNYCPGNPTTRDSMAVFVLVAKEGAGYTPPACVPPNDFLDVPETNPFCRFIEELARRGVVAGCGGGNYCPTNPVSREQMAVFVLRTLEPGLVPPACVPPNDFADVPETSPFCPFIEELARRAVVSGCGGTPPNYCPTQPVTREQMGVFISVTFGLTLYGP